MKSLPPKPLRFYSLTNATKYFKMDRRTLQKKEGDLYIIDKENIAFHNNKKYVPCKTCDHFTLSAKGRHGYCKSCQAKGLGKQSQGRQIAKRYKGEGNPNYVDGNSKSNFRTQHSTEYRAWRANVLNDKQGYHAHHILPYALFPEFKFEVWNGIALTPYQHITIHHLQLDLELLPIVHAHLSSPETDVQNLPEWYSHLPEVQSVLELDEKPFPEHELLRVVPSNYRKQLQRLHPEFVQQVFPQWES